MSKKLIINILVAVVLLAIVIYQIIDAINFGRERELNKTQWNSEQIETLINQSIQSVYLQNPELRDYPEIISDYSECIVDTITKHFSVDEYLKLNKLKDEELDRLLNPLYSKCNEILAMNLEPYIERIDFQKNLYKCIQRAMKKGNIDSIQAAKYCTCFNEYLASKYKNMSEMNIDSILHIEIKKGKECLEQALK